MAHNYRSSPIRKRLAVPDFHQVWDSLYTRKTRTTKYPRVEERNHTFIEILQKSNYRILNDK